MIKRILFLIFLFASPHLLKSEILNEEIVDSLFFQLDNEISNVKKYEDEKGRRIGFLKNKLTASRDDKSKIILKKQLFHEYQYYIYDSAHYYINRNIELLSKLPDRSELIQSKLLLCNLYITNGVFWEAESIIKSFDKNGLSSPEKVLLLSTEARLDYFLYQTVVTPLNKQKYLDRFMGLEDTLSAYDFSLKDMNPDVQYYYYEYRNDYAGIRQVTDSILNYADKNSRLYSAGYIYKSRLAGYESRPFEQIYYLIQASIYEQRNCIKNGRAIYELARLLYGYELLSKAHQYVLTVHNDAAKSNSIWHKSRSAELLAMITRSYEEHLEQTQSRLYRYLMIIGLLSLGLLMAGGILIFQMKRLTVTKNKLHDCHEKQIILNDKLNSFNNRLLQNNSLKEEYICTFLEMRPDYIESLNDYRKQVLRLVKEKKFSDVYEFCKSNKEITEEYEKLHEEFDKMFLDIYPDFIDRFNSLLQEDARMKPRDGELTIEMRIFALIRLGITDSSKIARYLRYSINTIYNYRSRTKLRALVSKDDFETEIRKIGCPEH